MVSIRAKAEDLADQYSADALRAKRDSIDTEAVLRRTEGNARGSRNAERRARIYALALEIRSAKEAARA